MQWSNAANGGFSKAKPWLPVPASAKTHNVESEMKDPDSVLSFYRQLLALRHSEPALLDGDYFSLNDEDPNVLTYIRRYKGEAILVIVNMSAAQQKARPDFALAGFSSPKVSVLLTSMHAAMPPAADGIPMEAYSVLVAKLTK